MVRDLNQKFATYTLMLPSLKPGASCLAQDGDSDSAGVMAAPHPGGRASFYCAAISVVEEKEDAEEEALVSHLVAKGPYVWRALRRKRRQCLEGIPDSRHASARRLMVALLCAAWVLLEPRR